MTMEVEGDRPDEFARLTRAATDQFGATLTAAAGVSAELLAFRGPHLVPADGAYKPLDFLRIGLTEKLERGVQFLLIVTEVDLASAAFTYTVALPSRLTNVAVVSTKRLDPAFRGEAGEAGAGGETVAALAALLTHSFGHLLNLDHHPDPGNVMYDFAGVGELSAMTALTDAQRAGLRRNLPREAHERSTPRGAGRLARRRSRRGCWRRTRGASAGRCGGRTPFACWAGCPRWSPRA